MNYCKLLVISLLFISNVIFCQEKWNVYNINNSKLAGNFIHDIAEDKQGNKWIGTDNGVSKFDGTNWTTFNTSNSGLVSNNALRIKIDNKGNKWISTDKGICKFDDINWTIYNKMDGVVGGDYLSAFTIDTAGNLWAASGDMYNYTIGKFDGKQWTKYNAKNSIFNGLTCWDIAIDSLNTKWIASEKGLFKFDDINWTIYDTTNSQISNNFIKTISIDQKGRKWIITKPDHQFDKISIFNDTTWKNFNNSEIVKPSSTLNDVSIDKDLNAWFSISNGLLKCDGNNWFNYNVNNSPLIDSSNNMLASLSVLNVMVDKNNIKWMGTTKGIFSLDTRLPTPPVCDSVFYNGPFSVVNQYSFNNPLEKGRYEITVIGYDHKGCQSKPTNIIIKVAPRPKVQIDKIDSIINVNSKPIQLKGLPAGGIFTGNGIIGDTLYPSKSNLGLMSITYQYKDSLKCSNTDVKVVSIIDTTKNIKNVDYIHFDTSNSGLLNNTINDIAFDAQNTCWIATNNGVSTYDNKEWKNYTTSNSKLSNDIVKSIAIDTLGNKWICTNPKNIDEFKVDRLWNNYNVNIQTNKVVVDKQNIKWFATNQGILEFNNSYNDSVWDLYNHQNVNLSDSIINSLFSLNNGLVLGTNKGVILFNTTYKTPDFQYDTLNSTISTNKINNVLVDKIGNIWAGTNKGLCKINFGSDYNVNSLVENYTVKNSGLLSDTILSLSTDTSGVVYIATKNGVTTFNGKKWETILSKKRGNNHYEILSMVTDKLGNKWFGTNNGLLKISSTNKTTFINDLESKSKILVYPNPASTSLTIYSKNENIKSVSLINVLGQMVLHQELKEVRNDVNLEGISKGMYVVSFFNDQNEIISSQKLSIE